MFTYLLLRDNKQLGPYSLEQLKESGIQATDLLWIEGRSIAWCYADEIDELQAFVHASPIGMNGAHISNTALQIDHKEEPDNKIRFDNKNEISVLLPSDNKAKPTEDTSVEKEPVSKRSLEARRNLFARKEPDASPQAQRAESDKIENNQDDISSGKVIKIIIADDHTLFREGVKTALSQKKDIRIIAEAENGMQLLHQLKHNMPDVILLDIQMPIMDGISALASIRKLYADLKVVILSMHEGHSMVSTLMEAGANGYLTKNADPEAIYQAIKTCYSKNYYFNDLTNVSMLEGLRSKSRIPEKIDTTAFDGANLMLKLTAAQKKSVRHSSQKAQKRILVFACSILLIGAGIMAGMSIMGRTTQSKQVLAKPPKKESGVHSTTNSHPAASAQTRLADSVNKQPIDSLQKQIDEELLSDKKNRLLLDNKKDLAEKRKRNRSADSSNASSSLVKQKVDSAANTNSALPAKQSAPAAPDLKALARNSLRSLVTASVNDYHKGAFGGLSGIEFTVNNRSSYTIDEVTVEVQYLLQSAKVYKTETLNFQNIAPSSSGMLEAPKSSRGVKIEYKIVSIRSKELEP